MTQPEPVMVRAIDRRMDAAEVRALDSSFSSDSIYETASGPDSLILRLRRVPAPVRKRYTIDLDATSWTSGFVAVAQGTLCGFIATRFEAWNRRLAIAHFYVDAKHRRRGIGRSLMKHAMDAGRREGAQTAWVETSNWNHPGVAAYQRLGFALCGFDLSLYSGTSSDAEFAVYLAAPLADHGATTIA